MDRCQVGEYLLRRAWTRETGQDGKVVTLFQYRLALLATSAISPISHTQHTPSLFYITANVMAPPTSESSLIALQACIASTQALINSFQLALQSPTPRHSNIEIPPQPLALLSDSCKVLKAQTTKLSLLILNKPFTPSAITYILNACAGGCLPAIMAALELCPAEIYGHLLHNHIRTSISRLMAELLNLIASIPQDERGIEPQSRDILASTGVLWAGCDDIVTLANDGIISLAIHKAEEYHSLLKDAIEELEQWDPEEEEDVSDTDLLSSQQQKSSTTDSGDTTEPAASLEALSVTDNIVELQKRSLSTFRIVRLIYPALKKRRIASFPNITSTTSHERLPRVEDINRLDVIILSTRRFTEVADEIAGALYEGGEVQVSKLLDALVREAKQCSITIKKNWRCEEDDFTAWVGKWLARLEEVNQKGANSHKDCFVGNSSS